MKKKQLTIFGILITAIIIGACFTASMMNPEPEPTKNDWVGISVHSLSGNEAKLVNESGACWIRVDASENFEVAVTNAKACNLKVLGILGSWMFNQSITFTLEEWHGNVTHYVLQYADYVDAWEIWNEPAHPN